MYNNYDYSDNRMNYNEMFTTFGLNNVSDINYNMNEKINKNNKLFGSYEGYMNGNMFTNLYKPYKNYKSFKIVPKTEEEELMINLDQIQFAMHDLNLYLDVYPDDQEMMIKFIEYRNKYNELLDEYQKRYSALNVCDPNINNVPFAWENEKFSWDRRGL